MIIFVNNINEVIIKKLFEFSVNNTIKQIFFYYKGANVLNFMNHPWKDLQTELHICSVAVEDKEVPSPFQVSSLGVFVEQCIHEDRIINFG